ncbi:LysR family transcriptional regulator [Anaeromicropila populeti]|uniref:DNA-binding transcriptional regulator, LysR family n=1 Tax=Anaeromicropila populeti TaxID=37658 RepID=A0A1I6I7C7_9FIRM|nr:LysR family transcriptional regulator [Anaeromicropila populeti]SFR62290.1 DNA-binding transcriptional regulator, LysR family [Anaeromicropila populeti]
MSLPSYQIFYAVVQQGSFHKAAEVLDLTPSAISHSITALEKEFGFSLFIRSKNGVRLTSSGEAVYPNIIKVLNSQEALLQCVSELNGLQKGCVKIGAFNSVCTNWMPRIIRTFQSLYPDIEISVFQGTYDDVIEWIKNGDVDFGFLSASCTRELSITPLYRDQLVCVVPKGFQTLHSDYITIDEMRNRSFVIQHKTCDADVQNFLQKYRLRVYSNCQVLDDQSTIAMVESGLGMCIMPSLIMENFTGEVDVFPIVPNEYRIIGLATQNSVQLAPAAKQMYQQIQELVKMHKI